MYPINNLFMLGSMSKNEGDKLKHICLAIIFLVLWPLAALAEISDSGAYPGGPSDSALGHLQGSQSPAQGGCKSALWAISPCGARSLSAVVPRGSTAMLAMDAKENGYAVLMERLPSGELSSRYLGYIYKGSSYSLPLKADSPGTHDIWYRVGFQESNRIKLSVLG